MANLKIGEELFLETQELNRLKKFIYDDGFEKLFINNTLAWGLVKNNTNSSFDNLKISEGTTGTINISAGLFFSKDSSTGIDKLRIGSKLAQTNIPIPNNSNWFWIKVSPLYRSLETGTVSIDSSGNLTGVGCEFTKVLRGGANIPSRIRFYQQPYQDRNDVDASVNATQLSVNNQLEYDVLEVIDDNTAILSGGAFLSETGIKYAVVGTFTPGYVVPSVDKFIFKYDDCLLEFITENPATPNIRPAGLISDFQFYIARVRFDGVNTTIHDKRNNIWQTRADFNIDTILASNPLIGVEKITYNHEFTPQDKNIVEVAFGFRSSNYSYNTNVNKIVVNAGLGGKYKNTNDFSDGDFNGWRVYVKDTAKYLKIQNSIKVGSTIELTVDMLDIDLFKNSDWSNSVTYPQNTIKTYGNFQYICTKEEGSTIGVNPSSLNSSGYLEWQVYNQEIVIVPDVEEVELKFIPSYLEWTSGTYTANTRVSRNGKYYFATVGTSNDPALSTDWSLLNTTGRIDDATLSQLTTIKSYSVFTSICKVELVVNESVAHYNATYRYKNNKSFSSWLPFPSDNGIGNERGYYPETFDYTSVPDNTTNPKVKYTNDLNNAYIKLKLSPTAYTNFQAKVDTGDKLGVAIRDLVVSTPQYNLLVGTNEQEQLFTWTGTRTLIQSVAINLQKPTSLKDGNKFVIRVKGKIDLATFRFIITQDFVNFSSVGNILYELTATETQFLKQAVDQNSALRVECIYDKETNNWIPFVSFEIYKDVLDQILTHETLPGIGSSLYTKVGEVKFTNTGIDQSERGVILFNRKDTQKIALYPAYDVSAEIHYNLTYNAAGTIVYVNGTFKNRQGVDTTDFVFGVTEFTSGVGCTVGLYYKAPIALDNIILSYKFITKLSGSKFKLLGHQPWSVAPTLAVGYTTFINIKNGDIIGGIQNPVQEGTIRADLVMETVMLYGTLLLSGNDTEYSSSVQIPSDDFFQLSSVDGISATLIRVASPAEPKAWSTKLGSSELRWDLPVDNVRRKWMVKMEMYCAIIGDFQATASNMSYRNLISLGNKTIVNGDTLSCGVGAPLHYISSGIVANGAIDLTTTTTNESVFTSDCKTEKSFRVHISKRGPGTGNIRYVKLTVLGIPY